MKLLKLLNNWKTALAYVAMSIPGLGDMPMLKGAVEALLNAIIAGAVTPQLVIDFVLQLLLATGVLHRVMKNINGAK